MGLFDKFRKNVEKVVEDIDEEKFSAPEDSQEALEAIAFSQTNELPPPQSSDLEETHQPTSGEDDLVSDEKPIRIQKIVQNTLREMIGMIGTITTMSPLFPL